MSDHAAEILRDAIVAVGFFATLCVLGACFVAFVWVMARSIDRTLELPEEEEGD